jgi:Fe-S oxidoreductase
MTFSNAERIVLLLAVAASAAVFARDLAAKLRHIRGGKSDRVRSDHLGERLARVVREVLFQSRVVGGRPGAGLMHAVVFLGFLAFALATADHFLAPFGLELLARLFGEAGKGGFQAALALVAVAVAVAITGLALRRFVLVKISPDPRSWSSGVVALFILLLMVTYLNGIRPEPILPKANWWLHALLIIVFPPLILRSKHFHILMAPVDVFFRTRRLGDYLPLNLDPEALEAAGEEMSLGLETLADVPWKMRMDFLTCVECKRCTEQCPAWNCGQELNPRGFILDGRAALGGDGSVVGSVISETALGQCTSCGACEAICPVGIEHLQLLLGAKRAQALASGKGMVAAGFLGDVATYGNPFAAQQEVRKQLIAELGIPLYEKGKTDYLLWLGCVWAYNRDARSSLEAMVRVLERAGVSWGVLAEESCSGHHSRRQGEELQFQTLAGENLARLKEQAVDKIVAPCPHCLHTLRREYPTLDESFAPRVFHHSQLLAELLADGRIELDGEATAGKRLTYHDPCFLARYEDEHEAPREVIRATGFDFVELGRRRRRTFCCGGGSAGFIREQQVERRVDQERKDEIAASGAQVLVTGCPECKMMLGAAVEETVDLVELVARSLAQAR